MAVLSLAKVSTMARMLLLFRLLWLTLAADVIEAWGWNNESQPIAIYRSRPDLLAPILTPLEGIHQPEKMAPGYFFVAPYTNMQAGVYIYDNNADLIYTSFGSYGPGPSHAPRVCTYHGKPHLCFYQGVQHTGWGHGHGVIMDQNYRMVRSVEPSCSYQASSDMHEFYLNENGSRAIMTQYVRQVYDLCPWGLCDGLGYLQTGWFQEIDVETGSCIFSWNSLDHVHPDEGYVLPAGSEISGDGESPETPWDYFHINSIEKSAFDGSYLVSARHVSAIYKIDGTTGKILWRLGGKLNDYAYNNTIGDITFGFQHNAEWVSDSDDESVISIFDNASNGFVNTGPHSTGKIIRLDHRTKIASLVEPPLDPPFVDGHTHSAHSQGNFQMNLPGANDIDIGGQQGSHNIGNRILSYGNDPFFSEYAWTITKNEETGEESGEWEHVFYGTLAWGYMMNYRVMKFDTWEGVPLTRPALWSYSRFGMNHTTSNDSPMVLYVSWNGHTQIDTFIFRGANTESARVGWDSPDWHILAAGVKKGGFETIYEHSRTYKYVYVEAFDKDSVSLGKSSIMDTFVPSVLMREHYCDGLACAFMDTNNPEREQMREDMKAVYDEWATSKTDDDGDDPDIYDSVYDKAEDETSTKKVLLYAFGFGLLGTLVIAIVVIASRHYVSMQGLKQRVQSLFGVNTRRPQEGTKGQYLGLSSQDTEIDEDEAELDTPLKARSTQQDLEGATQDGGVQVERQPFWRAVST